MARPTSNVYISCYWFLTVTLVATYSGNLIAFMTVTRLKLPIENLRDLASKPEYQAGVSHGSSNHDLFRVRVFMKLNSLESLKNTVLSIAL